MQIKFLVSTGGTIMNNNLKVFLLLLVVNQCGHEYFFGKDWGEAWSGVTKYLLEKRRGKPKCKKAIFL
jgi:hypothetical protein